MSKAAHCDDRTCSWGTSDPESNSRARSQAPVRRRPPMFCSLIEKSGYRTSGSAAAHCPTCRFHDPELRSAPIYVPTDRSRTAERFSHDFSVISCRRSPAIAQISLLTVMSDGNAKGLAATRAKKTGCVVLRRAHPSSTPSCSAPGNSAQ